MCEDFVYNWVTYNCSRRDCRSGAELHLIKCFYSGDWAFIVWNIVTTQVCMIYCQESEMVLYYRNVCYRCVHYGEVSSKATTVNCRSLRTACAARFNMRLEHGRLVPDKAVMVHNHPNDVSKAAMHQKQSLFDNFQ